MTAETPFSITREDSGSDRGHFVLTQHGAKIGTLDYRCGPTGPVYIDFVQVAPATRGTGLGKRLVEAAVAWARESRRPVVPICSYSRAVIDGDPSLKGALDGD
jgi:predicted GNAT family acetyltransferase